MWREDVHPKVFPDEIMASGGSTASYQLDIAEGEDGALDIFGRGKQRMKHKRVGWCPAAAVC